MTRFVTSGQQMPDSGWWQAYLQINDTDVTTPEQVNHVLRDLFPECNLAVWHIPQDPGVWLIELPAWALETMRDDGCLNLDNDGICLEVEMP